jgi:rhodanese-related sulfurtransferase
VVFDAQEQLAYAYKHIAGAISMPQDEVDARVAELSTDKLAVFYCT